MLLLKKSLILLFVICAVLLNSAAYGQELTEREEKIYAEYKEEMFFMEETDDNVVLVSEEVARKNRIPVYELNDILARGFNREVTAEDREMYDDVMEGLKPFDGKETPEDELAIFKKVGRKYGVSYAIVSDTILRVTINDLVNSYARFKKEEPPDNIDE